MDYKLRAKHNFLVQVLIDQGMDENRAETVVESMTDDQVEAEYKKQKSKGENPADAEKKAFMMKLVDQFKDFVSDSMDEGMHDDFPDHMEFIQACLHTFIENADFWNQAHPFQKEETK